MEPSTEDRGGADSLVDRVAGVATEVGVAGVRAVGMTIGYTGKMLRFFKDKGVSMSFPSKGIFTGGALKKWGGEKSSIKIDIAKAKRKMEALYLEIGKQSAKFADGESTDENGTVKGLVAELKSYESQIQRWNARLNEIDDERARSRHFKAAVKTDGHAAAVQARIKERIRDAERSITSATFASVSDRSIFDKVVHDLLDGDVEIRLLAAAELGKMAKPISVPILQEAIGYGDAYLTSEIITALININDQSCQGIFEENVNDDNYRIRLGCLRGLYKVAGEGSISYLIDGLTDKHAVVRKSAATFLGWVGKDDAAPALIQTLKDSDQDVRKAAAMSLSILRDPSSIMPLIRILGESDREVKEKVVGAIERISGKTVEFKLDAVGDELRENIEGLKEWWQKNNLPDVDDVMGVDESGQESGDEVSDETEAGIEAADVGETVAEDEEVADEPVEGFDAVTAVDEIIDIENYGADDEAQAGDDAVVTAGDDGESADVDNSVSFDKSMLLSMNKVKLSAKCDELGVEYSEEDTKAVMIEKIIEKCGN